MAAPRPKPTALKILAGNRGKRALPASEPQPVVGEPAMPEHLTGYAAGEWARQLPLLTQMRVLTLADIGALEILCLAYAEYRATNDALAGGLTYQTTTESGDVMIRPRPEVTMRSDAWRRYRAMLVEFGLTPSARAKVSALPHTPESAVEEWRKRRALRGQSA